MDEAQTRLIVMLTHHDRTVENAPEVFEACRGTGAEYWGMKEEGLPPERMRALYRRMQECGKKTALEVVAYTEAEGLQGARLAADCGCDLLMGTLFFDSIAAFCRTHGLRYLPFVGRGQVRFLFRGGLPLCACRAVLPAKAYLAGTLLPFLVLGGGSFLFLLLCPGTVSVLAALVNLMLPGADLALAWQVLRSEAAFIADCPDQAGFTALTPPPR